MDHYSAAHCLFCETGKERLIVNAIHEKQWGRAIFAQRINLVWKNHERREETVPLLPGYVFVYDDQADVDPRDFRKIPHVIRPLVYEAGADALRGSDLEFADWLWRQDGQIGVMKAIQVGDRVEIIDDLFKGMHGTITRMNRTRRKIHVTLNMHGMPLQVLLSYEVVKKID